MADTCCLANDALLGGGSDEHASLHDNRRLSFRKRRFTLNSDLNLSRLLGGCMEAIAEQPAYSNSSTMRSHVQYETEQLPFPPGLPLFQPSVVVAPPPVAADEQPANLAPSSCVFAVTYRPAPSRPEQVPTSPPIFKTATTGVGALPRGRVVLVAKALTNSDTNGRIILPRVSVEANLSFVVGFRAYNLSMNDVHGENWDMVIKSWANGAGHRRVYVLEQAGEFLKAYGLSAGDAVGICTHPSGGLTIEANTADVHRATINPTILSTMCAEVRSLPPPDPSQALVLGSEGTCARNSHCTKPIGHQGFCSGSKPLGMVERSASLPPNMDRRLPSSEDFQARESGGNLADGPIAWDGSYSLCHRTYGCAKAFGHPGFCSNHKGFKHMQGIQGMPGPSQWPAKPFHEITNRPLKRSASEPYPAAVPEDEDRSPDLVPRRVKPRSVRPFCRPKLSDDDCYAVECLMALRAPVAT